MNVLAAIVLVVYAHLNAAWRINAQTVARARPMEFAEWSRAIIA